MTMSLPVRVVVALGETFNRGRFRLAGMGVLAAQGNDVWVVDEPAAVPGGPSHYHFFGGPPPPAGAALPKPLFC